MPEENQKEPQEYQRTNLSYTSKSIYSEFEAHQVLT